MIKGEPAPSRPEGAIEPDPSLPRACVIGAGACGITVAKALYEARVPFDCFEMGPVLGGNWVFENPNGQSACYRNLEMNTSFPRFAYSDFPGPPGQDGYPMHWEVREYFEAYIDHFGIRDQITFETRVEHARRRDDGVWEVEISGAGAAGGCETRTYDAVFVCNGHHWDKRWPDFPGHFDGLEMHAHDFRDTEPFAGKRVIVVGMGNSGMDVSADCAEVAEAVFLSARRGTHVLRKRLNGKPIDQTVPPAWLPWFLKQKGMELFRRRSGDLTKYGMQEPDFKVGHGHPTVSDRIWPALESGLVKMKPNIRELRGDRVLFEDGSEERADAIIYCTGYKVTFPFFDEDLIAAPNNELPLFRRTFDPDVPGVYFIGFVQPFGAIMPIAELQGRWAAELLSGRYHLPPHEEMVVDMTAEREADAKRFYKSPRHTFEVDFDEWLNDQRKERRRGAKRAANAGNALPIEPRAAREPAPASA
jgi:cation diffusion facilitator CzcD-associated flavoprotein CzcO